MKQLRDAQRLVAVDEIKRYCAWIRERVVLREQECVVGDLTSMAIALALREECAQAADDWGVIHERARSESWPTGLTERIQHAINAARGFQRRLDSLQS